MLKLNTNAITLFGEIIFERRRLSRKQQRRCRNGLYLIVSDHPHWTLIATRRLGHLPIILRLQLHLDLKKIQELVLTHLWKCFFKVREDIKKKVLCSFRHCPNWRGGGGVWPCSNFLAFLYSWSRKVVYFFQDATVLNFVVYISLTSPHPKILFLWVFQVLTFEDKVARIGVRGDSVNVPEKTKLFSWYLPLSV